jgi:tetratricopeptide (TPR) repeat protein
MNGYCTLKRYLGCKGRRHLGWVETVQSTDNDIWQIMFIHDGLMLCGALFYVDLDEEQSSAAAFNKMGTEAVELGQLTDALEFFNRGREFLINNKTIFNDILLVKLENNIGCTLYILGRYGEAKQMFEDAFESLNSIQTSEDSVQENKLANMKKSLLIALRNNCACAELKEENNEKALITFKNLWEEMLKILENVICDKEEQPCNHPRMQRIIWKYSPFVDQEELICKDLVKQGLCRHQYSNEKLNLVIIVMNYSRASLRCGNYDEIVTILQDILRQPRWFSESELILKKLLSVRLARLLVLQGKTKQADEIIDFQGIDSLQIQKDIEDDSCSPFNFMYVQEICRILVYRGERSKSRELLDTALKVCEELYDKQHPLKVSFEKTIEELFPTPKKKNSSRTEELLKLLSTIVSKKACEHYYHFVDAVDYTPDHRGLYDVLYKFCSRNRFERSEDAIEIHYILIDESFQTQKALLSTSPEDKYFVITALCLLLEELLSLETKLISTVLTCIRLLSDVSQLNSQENHEMEFYKDYFGQLSYYLRVNKLRISENEINLTIIVTCGGSGLIGLDDDVTPEVKPLFRKIVFDESGEDREEYRSDLGVEARFGYFVFVRSHDLIDINELRRINKLSVESIESLDSPSVMVSYYGSLLIEVRPQITHSTLSKLYNNLYLLKTCVADVDEPMVPGQVKAMGVKDMYLQVFQRTLTLMKASDLDVLVTVFQYTVSEMEMVDVLQKTRKKCIFRFHNPSFGLLILHTKLNVLYLTLREVTVKCSANDAMANNTAKLIDDIMDDCSSKLNIAWTKDPGYNWCRVTDVQGGENTIPFAETAEEEDDLEKAQKANVRLTAQVEYLEVSYWLLFIYTNRESQVSLHCGIGSKVQSGIHLC